MLEMKLGSKPSLKNFMPLKPFKIEGPYFQTKASSPLNVDYLGGLLPEVPHTCISDTLRAPQDASCSGSCTGLKSCDRDEGWRQQFREQLEMQQNA